MKLLSKHINALGKVFGAEISSMTFQSKAKVYKELEEAGYLEYQEHKQGAFSWSEYILTHPGRIAYCEWAENQIPADATT